MLLEKQMKIDSTCRSALLPIKSQLRSVYIGEVMSSSSHGVINFHYKGINILHCEKINMKQFLNNIHLQNDIVMCEHLEVVPKEQNGTMI